MLRAAVGSRTPASFVYAGQTLAAMPFADELRSSHGDRVRIVPTRQQGRPDLAGLTAALDRAAAVYCCGPASMLAAAEAVFPADRLHTERFHPAVRSFAPSTPFEAVRARSERTIRVPADESLLEALIRAGYPAASGCHEGVCGSCELTVVAGEPEHRDDIGAPAGRMYACVSRALSSRLVLDL